MKAVLAAVAAAAVVTPSGAFAPPHASSRVSTSVGATSDRRDVINNLAKLVGGMIVTAGTEPAFAASNPALETFKRAPKRGGDGTFKPGKGMRAHETYDELMAASNPALETFKRAPKRGGDGTFKPGKGMRAHESFNELC
mmetsp:Transcript_11652/g.23805  ORF Transcript_11652/g.23805 Transcript_11652/m.23805 type:complete len:140 (+) Transcript_11652:189-608(+)